MGEKPDDLVLLTTADGALEATMIRTTLDGAGIQVLGQGEYIGGIAPHLVFGTGVPMRVRRADLAHARALLSNVRAVPDEKASAPAEGAVCPVHELSATGTCVRCGSFLCGRCPSLGSPPVCEDCMAHEERGPSKAPGRRTRLKVVATILLLPLAMSGVALAATIVARLLGLLPR